MFQIFRKSVEMVSDSEALSGRDESIPTAETHFVFGRPLTDEVPEGFEVAIFGMGCFLGRRADVLEA